MDEGDDFLKSKEFAALNPHLFKWVNESLQDSISRGSMVENRWKLFLSCVAYGEKFVDRLLKYCIPSILADGNIPAIIGENPVWLVIHTDDRGEEMIRANGSIQWLATLGACIEIRKIPKEILQASSTHPAKYITLSAAHNIQMQMAKYLGYSYHLLMPDHVYSQNYFSQLRNLARSCDAIVHTSLSAKIENIAGKLENSGILAMDGKELNALALDNLHPVLESYVMNGRDYKTNICSNSYLLCVGEKVHISTPHMSPMYLSHKVLAKCPMRLYNTVDTQLAYFIPEWAKVVTPTPEDDMVYIEISDASKDNYISPVGDLLNFCIRFWMVVFCEKDFLRFFELENVLALPDGYKSPYAPLPEEEIKTTFSAIRKRVAETRDAIYEALDSKYRKDPLPQRAA